MANIVRLPHELMQVDNFVVFNDFTTDQADTVFIDTVTDSGSVAIGDAVGGVATLLPSDGTVTNNDEAYFACPNEVFKLAAGKPLYGVAYLKFTEGNTDDANIAFMFQNAIGADSIIDDGAGLKVSGSTLGIYKVDGGLVWKCVTAVNGTSTVSTSSALSTSSSYQKLEIIVNELSTTQFVATFKVDDNYLLDSTTGLPIRHVGLYASATEMQIGVGIKNGADTTVESLLLDYVCGAQVR